MRGFLFNTHSLHFAQSEISNNQLGPNAHIDAGQVSRHSYKAALTDY